MFGLPPAQRVPSTKSAITLKRNTATSFFISSSIENLLFGLMDDYIKILSPMSKTPPVLVDDFWKTLRFNRTGKPRTSPREIDFERAIQSALEVHPQLRLNIHLERPEPVSLFLLGGPSALFQEPVVQPVTERFGNRPHRRYARDQ